MKRNQKKPSSMANAFTMIETVIALGIVALIIPISMATILTASKSNREAGDDTAAAFIARSILEDLHQTTKSQSFFFKNQTAWNGLIANPTTAIYWGFDNEGQIITSGTPAEPTVYAPDQWTDGVHDQTLYLVKISADSPPNTVFTTAVAHPDLITILIQSPAAAAQTNRKTYRYKALYND